MRVIVAARLSVLADGQTGLDSQEREVVAWAERNGHTVVAVVGDNKTGKSHLWDRPNLRPWVTDPMKLSEYDAVVALKVDRLTRADDEGVDAMKAWAREHGKSLLISSAEVRFPSEGMEGAMWDMHIRMAHAEWLAIRERYVRSQAYLRARGSLVGKAPWGFQIGPGVNANGEPIKTLLPTAEGRTYVPAIFQKVIAGTSLAAVAAWLDSEGIHPTREARASMLWTEWSLARMVRNTVYSGTRKAADGTVELECEALVTIDTQRQAIEMLARRVKPGRSTVKHEKALLSGLKCGSPKCDASGTPDTISPMYRIQPRGGQWYQTESGEAPKGLYYRCKGTGPQRKGCGNMVPMDALDALVVVAFETWNDQPYTAHEYVPGDSTADLVDRLRLKASQAKTRTEANAQWDQIEQLEAQPSTEGHWETVTYDYSVADHFLSLDTDGRRAELAKHDIRAWKAEDGLNVTIDGAGARKGPKTALARP